MGEKECGRDGTYGVGVLTHGIFSLVGAGLIISTVIYFVIAGLYSNYCHSLKLLSMHGVGLINLLCLVGSVPAW